MAAGTLLTLTVPKLQKRRGNEISGREWISNGTLQLHRIAYENLGLGDWDGVGNAPVVKSGQMGKAPIILRMQKTLIQYYYKGEKKLNRQATSTWMTLIVTGNREENETSPTVLDDNAMKYEPSLGWLM